MVDYHNTCKKALFKKNTCKVVFEWLLTGQKSRIKIRSNLRLAQKITY